MIFHVECAINGISRQHSEVHITLHLKETHTDRHIHIHTAGTTTDLTLRLLDYIISQLRKLIFHTDKEHMIFMHRCKQAAHRFFCSTSGSPQGGVSKTTVGETETGAEFKTAYYSYYFCHEG